VLTPRAVLASALQFLDKENPLRGALGVVSIMAYGISFCLSLGPIPSILSSELFPSEFRSVGMSTSVAFQWFFNALVSLMFPVLQAQFGTEIILWFFAAMSGLCWLFTFQFVPETSGKSLEELSQGK